MGALHGGHQGKAWQSQLNPPPAQIRVAVDPGQPQPDHQASPWGLGWVTGLRVGPAWQGCGNLETGPGITGQAPVDAGTARSVGAPREMTV